MRISERNSDACRDYDKLLQEINYGADGFGRWDKDHNNTMEEGDLLCFVIGKGIDERVIPYDVVSSALCQDRDCAWKSDKPYNEGNNGQGPVQHRDAIRLKPSTFRSMEWSMFRRLTKLSPNCASWRPRGTQRIVNKGPILNHWESEESKNED